MTKTKWCVIQKTKTKSEFAVKMNIACLTSYALKCLLLKCFSFLNPSFFTPYSLFTLPFHITPLLVPPGLTGEVHVDNENNFIMHFLYCK